MVILYDLIFILFAFLYIPYLTIKGKWHKGFSLRLGFFSKDLISRLNEKSNIWIHAVSVGEVLAVVDLIREIKKAFPNFQIVCSTVTKTGNTLAREKLDSEDIVIYAPLDFSLIVKKFIGVINPYLYIPTETEIWPNLYTHLQEKGIPVVVINGRISDHSFGGYSRIRFLVKKIFKGVDHFCVQSELDAQRAIALGADPMRVNIVGNMKFDMDLPREDIDKISLGYQEEDVIFMAGSTHPGEEEFLLDIYRSLIKSRRRLRMIIAPRHIERTKEIVDLAREKKLKTIRYSQLSGEKIGPDTVLFVDTIGHLRSLYQIARIVFVGKTICGIGGQNIIEPAILGKPILVGPHMENFKDIMAIFSRQNAVLQVKDAKDLKKKIAELLTDDSRCERLGSLARGVVESSRGATQKTLGCLKKILSKD